MAFILTRNHWKDIVCEFDAEDLGPVKSSEEGELFAHKQGSETPGSENENPNRNPSVVLVRENEDRNGKQDLPTISVDFNGPNTAQDLREKLKELRSDDVQMKNAKLSRSSEEIGRYIAKAGSQSRQTRAIRTDFFETSRRASSYVIEPVKQKLRSGTFSGNKNQIDQALVPQN